MRSPPPSARIDRLPAAALSCCCPAKQRWALLESNPPRDSWIEGDEIKNVSAFGEAKTSPNENRETFISEPEHASKNSSFLSDEVAIIFASGLVANTQLTSTALARIGSNRFSNSSCNWNGSKHSKKSRNSRCFLRLKTSNCNKR